MTNPRDTGRLTADHLRSYFATIVRYNGSQFGPLVGQIEDHITSLETELTDVKAVLAECREKLAILEDHQVLIDQADQAAMDAREELARVKGFLRKSETWARRWKRAAKEFGSLLKVRSAMHEEEKRLTSRLAAERDQARAEVARLRVLLQDAFVEIDPMRESIIARIAEALAPAVSGEGTK